MGSAGVAVKAATGRQDGAGWHVAVVAAVTVVLAVQAAQPGSWLLVLGANRTKQLVGAALAHAGRGVVAVGAAIGCGRVPWRDLPERYGPADLLRAVSPLAGLRDLAAAAAHALSFVDVTSLPAP